MQWNGEPSGSGQPGAGAPHGRAGDGGSAGQQFPLPGPDAFPFGLESAWHEDGSLALALEGYAPVDRWVREFERACSALSWRPVGSYADDCRSG